LSRDRRFRGAWDAAEGGSITTQGDTSAELQSMIADAIQVYFHDQPKPARIRLHFSEDPVLAVA